ncbi:Cytokine-like protein 1 [Saguinus oedipus]|uniref:Cytokine-like protein 1 n=1 Tax=Saguinus oedipus TaxID=9490 RepID=A0ABQ9W1H8_SAGOE|nr:Cytokine-like protein 1 [Saguinus oedipus]
MRTPEPLPVLLLLLAGVPAAWPTPPTCYSRLRALSQEINQDFQLLQVSSRSHPFLGDVTYGTRKYCACHSIREAPGIWNYCVLDKLQNFVTSTQCRRVAPVDSLKEKARKLYTIMNSYCRRDLVFLSDDCNALEYPILETPVLPDRQR